MSSPPVARRRVPVAALEALRAALLFGIACAPLAAQEYPPLVVEGRAGVTLPTDGAGIARGPGEGIARAPSFGLHFVYRGPSGWGPYIGFSQHRFDCTADGCPGAESVATAWDLGMQRTLGENGRAWIRLGSVFGRVERDLGMGPRASRLGLGGEAGFGGRVPLRGRLALTPGVRYGWLNSRFRDGPLVRLRWVTADLGVALGF